MIKKRVLFILYKYCYIVKQKCNYFVLINKLALYTQPSNLYRGIQIEKKSYIYPAPCRLDAIIRVYPQSAQRLRPGPTGFLGTRSCRPLSIRFNIGCLRNHKTSGIWAGCRKSGNHSMPASADCGKTDPDWTGTPFAAPYDGRHAGYRKQARYFRKKYG